MALIGGSLLQSHGLVVTSDRRTHAALAELIRQPRAGEAPWMILGRFENDHRSADDWRGADGAMLDFDFEDPAQPAGDAHIEVPAPVAAAWDAEVAGGGLPAGVYYPTRRGFRYAVLFDDPVRDATEYADAVKNLARCVLSALDEAGLPLAAQGRPGFKFDESSARPSQPQRLPLPGTAVRLVDGPIWDSQAIASVVAGELNIKAALPTELAVICVEVGRSIQIAPVVAVVHLLAVASALIGNTRVVATRNLRHNLALQFLTLLPSSSGKSTVRQFFDRAVAEIRREVYARRKRAMAEMERYQQALDEWKAARRRTRPTNDPAPTPPSDARVNETFDLTEGTLEGVYKALAESPRGVLWTSSEAHEVLAVMGRYGGESSARNLDTARLRKLTEGEDIEVHRASRPIQTIRSPFLAIDIDAQPGIEADLFSDMDRVSGLTARFLVHRPPAMFGKRRYVKPPPPVTEGAHEYLAGVFQLLWRIELTVVEGVPCPVSLRLDADAELTWAEELERFESRLPNMAADEQAFVGHLRGRLLRLAAVLALLDDPAASSVGIVAMRRAIVVGRYFVREYRKLSSQAAADALKRDVEAVTKWANGRIAKNLDVTVRELARDIRRYRANGGEAAAVAHLRAAGFVPMKAEPLGGPGRPPAARWVPTGDPQKPAKSAEPGYAGFRGQASVTGTGDEFHARFAAANAALASKIELPAGGKGDCPLCRHAGCFGRIKDADRWKCFSASHAADSGGAADSGDLIDLWVLDRTGRLPSVAERIAALRDLEGGVS